ncbi:hypothetical protein KP509_32G019500 [Ceratopteris richardii]|uniref:NB-ARC domain-containing protein n=1 Tax=Ceratopteris richardii TaxID=49495 RepID=A0A8T2QTM9_CERRI|nr:hypothetical protein KP509_32G019500 [Ceratopteris richardii]
MAALFKKVSSASKSISGGLVKALKFLNPRRLCAHPAPVEQSAQQPVEEAAQQSVEGDFTLKDVEKMLKIVTQKIEFLEWKDGPSSSSGPELRSQSRWANTFHETVSHFNERKQNVNDFINSLPNNLKDEVLSDGGKLLRTFVRDVFGEIGGVHWIGLGFSFIAWTLDNLDKMGDNADRLLKLLRNLQDVLKKIVETWKIADRRDEDAKELQEIVDITFECVILCTANLGKGKILRFFEASTVENALNSMEKRITEATTSIDSYRNGVVYRNVPYQRQPTIALDENLKKVESREKEKQNALEFYQKKVDDGPVVLIIRGDGGVGKTVLASQIFYEFQCAKGKDEHVCVRTELPFEVDEQHLSRIQEDILKKLGVPGLNNVGEPGLNNVEDGKATISKALKSNEKPVFLYVDNINFEGHISKLLPQSKSFKTGSKILITTRSRLIKGRMDEDLHMKHIKVTELEPLKREEAQNFLSNTIFEGGISESELGVSPYKIGEVLPSEIKKVLKLCDGLPLALNSVAKCAIRLYKKNIKVDVIWKSIASSMERCSNFPCSTENMYKSLRFSYDRFCDDKEKEAFLDIIFLINIDVYSSVFLDWKRIEMLIGVTNIEHLHSVGLIEKVVEMRECCFVRVHDVYRVMGKRMQEERKHGIYVMDDNELKRVEKVNGLLGSVVALYGVHIREALVAEMPQVRYLFDVVIEGAMEEPHMETVYNNLLALHAKATFANFIHRRRFPKLVEFVVEENKEATDLKFLEDSTALRRLSLTSWESLSNVDAIQNMASLRELGLAREKLSSLPEGISRLTSLEDLRLRWNDKLSKLPSGISCLTSLRYLSLRGCSQLRRLPESITSMTWLQFLDLGYCSALEDVPQCVESLKNTTLVIMPNNLPNIESLEDMSKVFPLVQFLLKYPSKWI